MVPRLTVVGSTIDVRSAGLGGDWLSALATFYSRDDMKLTVTLVDCSALHDHRWRPLHFSIQDIPAHTCLTVPSVRFLSIYRFRLWYAEDCFERHELCGGGDARWQRRDLRDWQY